MKKSKFCHLPRNGFSLLELLVVLLLVALGSVVAVPAIDRVLRERELRLSTLELAAVARDLRSRAVYEGTLQQLVINRAENSYEALRGGRVFLSSGVRIAAVQGGDPLGGGIWRFLFFPNGSTIGGEILIAGRRGSSYSIRLHPLSGRIEVGRDRR